MKTTKNKRNTLLGKAKYILESAVKTVLVTAAVMLGMKLLGNVLELASNYISVGAGLFMIFAAACFFIHMDTKNSIEQSGEEQKAFVKGRRFV